ncbi:TAXI family TRAP transporter solute-binding subunit [Agarivorans sp. MS3-6]|uniref:TAXI family TRAP transporter solute-binding subunit n=1 Tax=Agarivorans sp. TSD2052 TaxID=2937286 RepID=UPI00201041BB|nr:TAXI family TRAP transporter solute-binding subunit [Agarivorans sp. TSD2052]UPW19925.1 TAXI family TRAP transporter solute-binding subunit [Agarivorans sp. TSD2052]
MRFWLRKAALLASVLTFTVQADSGTNYLLATASTGGTYYPVGVALATLTKVKIQPKHKVSVSAINSAGSGENIKLLRDKEAQFAILQGLYGSYAVNGTGPLEKEGKQAHLRSITMLWQNVEQFVVKKEYAKNGDLSDLLALTGEKLALGKKNSGTIGSNRFLLGNLGVDIDKQMELFSAGYGPSAEALQNGQVAGINTPAGAPTGAVTKLFAAAAKDVAPLDVTDQQIEQANGGLGLWTRYVIPAGTYPKQDNDWNTMAQPNFLAVHADVDEEFVYLLTKTIYENLGFLQAIHKATNAMALEKALAGLPAPLHPGAARYYREAGLTIPDNLVAN